MHSRAEANKRSETLSKANNELVLQMKQMRKEIDDLKISTLSKVGPHLYFIIFVVVEIIPQQPYLGVLLFSPFFQ